jgi:hypothetical protein
LQPFEEAEPCSKSIDSIGRSGEIFRQHGTEQ